MAPFFPVSVCAAKLPAQRSPGNYRLYVIPKLYASWIVGLLAMGHKAAARGWEMALNWAVCNRICLNQKEAGDGTVRGGGRRGSREFGVCFLGLGWNKPHHYQK